MSPTHIAAIFALAAAAIFLAPRVAVAEPVPPPFHLPDSMPELMVSSPPVTGIRLGRLDIVFEKIPLSQIVANAGVGEITHSGDASESISWVCYTILGSLKQRIWLIAGELDGPNHFISGVQAAVLSAEASAIEGCPSLPAHLLPVSLRSGIWLGSSAISLSTINKKSSVSERSGQTYSYTGKISGSDGGQKVLFDRASFLHLTMSGGRVQGIVASQSTTY